MNEIPDSYKTIGEGSETVYRQFGSKFLAFSYYVTDETQIRQHLDTLRKTYFDATHHCYAWRLGPVGEPYRAADDCEPAGTAGRPILGQLLSAGITDSLVVVVRYFGGTKLGVPGLIAAYRQSAADVIAASTIVERTVDEHTSVQFGFESMNDVMRIVKEFEPRIIEQTFDNLCRMTLAIRLGRSGAMRERLSKVEGLIITTK